MCTKRKIISIVEIFLVTVGHLERISRSDLVDVLDSHPTEKRVERFVLIIGVRGDRKSGQAT